MKENSTKSQFYAEKEFWNNRFEKYHKLFNFSIVQKAISIGT